MRIAVIGAGVSGNVVAHLLAPHHDVTLFEANSYAGGHTNTLEIDVFQQRYRVDTGFMVFNARTYPGFCRLLRRLGIGARLSDMSFSVRCRRTGLEYQGSSLNGLFAQRRNLWQPRFYGMLVDILRFNRQSLEVLQGGYESVTLEEYLAQRRYAREFVEQYLLPMSAAIWSARPRELLQFPVHFLIAFFRNHGLLQLRDRPVWQTIVGGADRYVRALLEPLRDRVRLGCPVQSVTRHEDTIVVQPRQQPPERFDEVVIATHADQALRLLTDADPLERSLLGALPYQRNEAVLHTDCSLLPRQKRAWASWNYYVSGQSQDPAAVTYDLSRLQGLSSPRPILLTLNNTEAIDPSQVIERLEYEHPAYGLESLQAQARHADLLGRRHSYFCGAYWGYGFHEDGVQSALEVARRFGCELSDTAQVNPIAGESP